MKTKHLLISLAIGLTAGFVVFSGLKNQKEEASYIPRGENIKNYGGIAGYYEWLNKRLINLETGTLELSDIMQVREQIRQVNLNKGTSGLDDIDWHEMGPDNVGGRTRSILIDKDNHNIMYAGSVAGGLWKSISGGTSWNLVTKGDFTNLAIGCIAQTPNGHIFFGTGEVFANSGATPFGTPKMMGQGIYRSVDGGNNFSLLTSTWPTSSGAYLDFTNELAVNVTTGKIWAATSDGLFSSANDGDEWVKVQSGDIRDIQIASDGTIIFSDYTGKIYLSTDNGDTFDLISSDTDDETTGNADQKITHHLVSRTELAFSPQDPNYIYAAVAAAYPTTLKAVYRSTDKGATWQVIGTRSTLFQPFTSLSGQGSYNNIIKVYPDNKNKVLLGGSPNIWLFENETWSTKSTGYVWEQSPLYVHADHHAIVFHPDYTSNGTFYIGSDGGVSRYTPENGFQVMNRNYNVTQFYTVYCSGTDEVMGGTQDNGTQYINQEGNTASNATEFSGGDGGHCAFSVLNPDVIYSSVYGGKIYRTDKNPLDGAQEDVGIDINQFVTTFKLWESFNDSYSIDSVEFIHDTVFDPVTGDTILDKIYQGDTLMIASNISGRNIIYIVQEDSIDLGEKLVLQDPYQAMMVLAGNNQVYFARNPLDFSATTLDWHPITVSTTDIDYLDISTDGDWVWAAAGQSLYRLKNVLQARYYQYPSKDTVPYNTYEESDIIDHFDTVSTTQILDTVLFDTTGYTYDTVSITIDSIVLTNPDTVIYDTSYTINVTPIVVTSWIYTTEYLFDTVFVIDTIQHLSISNVTVTVDNFQNIVVEHIKTFNKNITCVNIAYNDPDKILVTLGNYGGTEHVQYCSNGTAAIPTFTGITDNLPTMPVYCGIFEKHDPKVVLIGTEHGIWATEDITASTVTWTQMITDSLGTVPVFQITQQRYPNGFLGMVDTKVRNSGFIYIATHGRGIFKTEYYADQLTSIPQKYPSSVKDYMTLKVYPNPTSDYANVSYSISKKSNVEIKVYDIYGKLMLSEKLQNMPAGEHPYSFSVDNFSTGTYIVNINDGEVNKASKFIVY